MQDCRWVRPATGCACLRSRGSRDVGLAVHGDPAPTRPPASLVAKLGSQPILAQRPLAEWKAGPWTAPRRGVRVPAPEEKQGVRADRDDDVRADGVARPAGGEYRGPIAVVAKTRSAGGAVLRSSAVAVSVSSLGRTPRCRGVTNDAIRRIPGFAITFGHSPPSLCSATTSRHPSPSAYVNRHSLRTGAAVRCTGEASGRGRAPAQLAG
jgi:hypothetical protein